MGLFGDWARRRLARRRARWDRGGAVAPAYGNRRPGGRFGMWGPVPHYTRRTRRGNEVSVGGCVGCLPIPLIGLLGLGGVVRGLRRAR